MTLCGIPLLCIIIILFEIYKYSMAVYASLLSASVCIK